MSGLSQIVGQNASGVSTLLVVDTSGRSQVKDTDNIVQTTATNAHLVGIDAVLDNSLVQQTAVNTGLTAIDAVLDNSYVSQQAMVVDLAAIEVKQTAIAASLAGTLAVSAPTITTQNSILRAAVSVADAVVSTTAGVDLGGVRHCAVFGSLTDGSANIKVQVSTDDTTYFDNSEQSIYISGVNYYKSMSIDARYVRLSYTNGSGASATWTANLSRKL